MLKRLEEPSNDYWYVWGSGEASHLWFAAVMKYPYAPPERILRSWEAGQRVKSSINDFQRGHFAYSYLTGRYYRSATELWEAERSLGPPG